MRIFERRSDPAISTEQGLRILPEMSKAIAQLREVRSFKEKNINGRLASMDGPIKAFALRGIKDTPPYLHDDRLLAL